MINIEYFCCLCALFMAFGAFYLCYCAVSIAPKHNRIHGLPELLPWARMLGDNIVLLKNGALMSCYRVQGIDASSLTNEELMHRRELLSVALLKMGGNWALFFDAVRTGIQIKENSYYGPTEGNRLDKAHTAKLKEQELYETSYVISLIQRPNFNQKNDHARLNEFIKERDALIASFAASMSIQEMKSDDPGYSDLLSYFKSCLEGRSLKVALPEENLSLDSLLATADFQPGLCPKIGDSLIACVGVDTYPSSSTMSMLEALCSLPFPCRFSTRFICNDSIKNNLLLRHHRRFFEQRRKGFLNQVLNVETDRTDKDAEDQIDDIEEAICQLTAKTDSFGAITQLIVITSDSFETLQKRCRIAISAIEDLGFGARVETINATEAFLGSLPGELGCNIRRPVMSTKATADLLPTNTIWHGESTAPNKKYPGEDPLLLAIARDNGLFYLNLHTSDTGNTLVSGPPGSGKSVFMNALILSLMRYKGMKIWAFERGYSLSTLCMSLGGTHITLDGSVRLGPLTELESIEDRNRAHDFVRHLLVGNGKLNATDDQILKTALEILSSNPVRERTLSALADFLSCSKELSNSIKPYLCDSGDGILDGTEDPGFNGNLSVYECASLLERPLQSEMVLRHLLSKIRRECEKTSTPKAIILDEAWLMLRDEVFVIELLAWLKTLRKHNTIVVMATQNLSDLRSSKLEEALFDCIKTRIYLPNPDATQPYLSKSYLQAGLNQEQIEQIAKAISKRELFIQKEEHFAKFSLILSDEEKKIFTKSGAEALMQLSSNDDRLLSPKVKAC